CSISSSGPMQTAAIWLWGPTTCSRAATNSVASPMSDQHHTDHRNPFARPRPLPFADTSARPDDRRAGACARRAADSPGAGGETADQARKHEIDASTQGRGRSLLMPGAWGAGPAGAWEYCGGWI